MAHGAKGNSNWRSGERRSQQKEMAPERHLIASEGTKTEPQYFKEMKKTLKPEFQRSVKVTVRGTGKHTTDLLGFAIDACKLKGPFDHVWLVYDKDDFPDAEFDEVAQRCKKETFGGASFHALWSNPCFELWLLLHFQYTTGQMNSRQAFEKLDAQFKRKFAKPYSKTEAGYFEKLQPQLLAAKNNALRLHKWHDENEQAKPSEMNPCTNVFELLEEIGDYLGLR